MADLHIGTLQLSEDRQVRFSRVTKRGRPCIDVREMDLFNGFWTPNKRAVVIPAEHAGAFAKLAYQAAEGSQ